MSTIVITKTHIGQDHCVVSLENPPLFGVDLGHRKIFVSADERVVFATVGPYSPEIIEKTMRSPLAYRIFSLLREVVDVAGDKWALVDNTSALEVVKKSFPHVTHFIMAADGLRLTCRIDADGLEVRHCGEYYAVGISRWEAIGLLHGGYTINTIWKPLNALNRLTSKEHSVFKLSNLIGWNDK